MAFTDLPPAGRKLTAATLSGLITEMRSPRKVVTSGQNLNTSSTTLQDITALAVPVIAGTYRYEMRLTYEDVSNTPDLKVAFTFPTATSASYAYMGLAATATGSPPYSLDMGGGSLTSGTAFVTVGTVGLRATLLVHGHFIFTASGTVQVRAAQNTSDASTITIHPGSYLDLAPIV